MNIKQQVLSLVISVTPLVCSGVFATPLVAETQSPKLPVSTQIVAQQSASSNSSKVNIEFKFLKITVSTTAKLFG